MKNHFECFVSTDNLWKGAAAAGALVAAGVALAVQAGAAAPEAKATPKSLVAPRVAIQGRAAAPLAEATAKTLVAVGGASEEAEAPIAGATIAILLFLFLLGATVVLALAGARRSGARTTRKTSRPVDKVAEVATNCWKLTVRQFLKTDMVIIQIYPKLIQFTVWFTITFSCMYAFSPKKLICISVLHS